MAFGSVTLSAANTLTFDQVSFAVGLFQGVAMLMHRILWKPASAFLRELTANTDQCIFALTTTNRLTTLEDSTDPSVIAYYKIVGMGAGVEPIHLPLITDFSTLPGGGKLVAANPIFLAAVSSGYAAALGPVLAQIDFTFVNLSDAQYLEVLQAQFPANI